MYEAAIKTAWTGVYFAVPYMAKLIIEFMEKNYQKENRNLRKSRDLLVERILHRYPARRVDSDDDLFDALEEYDSYRNERYECLADDQSKLCKLFMSNPKMGAFISDCTGAKPYYTNANETADGFWVTFTNETQVNVYFGGINWPNPLVTISVPEGFDTAKRLYVITNQNGVYYWMETAAGEQILLVSAIFTEDDSTVTVYDGSGQSVWSGANEIDRSVGGFFRAFNHFCQTQIDNLLLKAY